MRLWIKNKIKSLSAINDIICCTKTEKSDCSFVVFLLFDMCFLINFCISSFMRLNSHTHTCVWSHQRYTSCAATSTCWCFLTISKSCADWPRMTLCKRLIYVSRYLSKQSLLLVQWLIRRTIYLNDQYDFSVFEVVASRNKAQYLHVSPVAVGGAFLALTIYLTFRTFELTFSLKVFLPQIVRSACSHFLTFRSVSQH